MIVTPTSDVVLDVLEAADPAAQREAAAKLDALTSRGADFATTLSSQADNAGATASATHDQSLAAADGSSASSDPVLPAQVIQAPSQGEVYRKFEAFVLQVFVEAMLPQQSQDIFGKGTAGSVWRSMLAEQLGNQLAHGKGIGIARQLAGAHLASRDDRGGAV
jgi:peptidoglycan hydrolase FlgJ